MDYPPELEKAEAELQAFFQKERARTKWSLADTLIGLAAIIHFLWGITCVLGFIILPFAQLVTKGPDFPTLLWLIALPMGATSLGMACGLIRILDLTPNRLNQINNDKAVKNPQ